MFNKKADLTSNSDSFDANSKTNFAEPRTPDIKISTPAMEPERPKASNSIIDEWLIMRGDLESEGDILVKGKIRGNIHCKLLIVDDKASIEGGITAQEVVVRGSISGEVRATRVRLEETAVVDSAIYHRSFSVAEGAQIKGALHFEDDPLANATSLATTEAVSTAAPSKDSEAQLSAAAKKPKDVAMNGSVAAH